jgi:hypothetical protein
MQQQGLPPGFWAVFIVILLIGLTIGLIIHIFFLLTLYRTQSAVAERNRELQPGLIWLTLLLNFIPLVGNLWVIYMVTKLSDSLRREFEDRGWRTQTEGFGRTPGLLWAWGSLIYTAFAVVQNVLMFSGHQGVSTLMSLLMMPIAIGLLVCFILYWVQMYQYGKRLRESEYRSDGPEADFDDQFNRPRRDEADDFDRPRRGDEA